MVKAEFDEFENQHKSESDETQTLLNNRFDKIDAKLDSIKAAVDSMKLLLVINLILLILLLIKQIQI